MVRIAGLAMIGLLAFAAPAQAYCPTLPANTEQEAAENDRQRMLCLSQQIDTTARTLEQNAQINSLTTTIQRNSIQRRFDMLPPVTPARQF